jgi:hypothetical protein
MSNLPREEFVLGVLVTRPANVNAFLGDSRPLQAVVEVVLSDGNGKVLMRRRAPLKEWTWSVPSTNEYAFIYGKEGEPTYFTPPSRTDLQLSVRVSEPDAASDQYSPKLIAKSGGWK